MSRSDPEHIIIREQRIPLPWDSTSIREAPSLGSVGKGDESGFKYFLLVPVDLQELFLGKGREMESVSGFQRLNFPDLWRRLGSPFYPWKKQSPHRGSLKLMSGKVKALL